MCGCCCLSGQEIILYGSFSEEVYQGRRHSGVYGVDAQDMGSERIRIKENEGRTQMEHQERVKKGRFEMIISYNPNAVEPPDLETYICPVCGEEIEYGTYLYYNANKECVGCEYCLETKLVEDAYEEDRYAVRERLYDY